MLSRLWKCMSFLSFIFVCSLNAFSRLGQVTETCEVLGDASQTAFQRLETMESTSGLKITYSNGDICQNSEIPGENGMPRKINFKVMCDGSTEESFVQTPLVAPISKCNLEFTIRSSAGCPVSLWSFGSFKLFKILLWAIVVFAIYGIAGTIYNQRLKDLKGVESFPHIDFWRQTPAVALETLRSSLNILKKVGNRVFFGLQKESSSGPNGRGYVTV